MRLLNIDFIGRNMFKKLYILILLMMIPLMFDTTLRLHALDIQHNTMIHSSNSIEDTNSLRGTEYVCRIHCPLLPLRKLLYRNDTNRVCCWLMSVDKSHKIYIDVNVNELLGKGSRATVYRTCLHDNVK